ncbi:hypothetical protein [Dyadobacter flavalbus]|nr:hypothetical protein [Dyadobacter flavalbus]
MKKHCFFLLWVRAGSLSGMAFLAQNASMLLNPNALKDIKRIGGFVNAMTVSGEQARFHTLLGSNYAAHEPGGGESV